MAKPIALCIEREGATEDQRYVRCTARVGRKAGLALGLDGSIRWQEPGPVACEVWVSADQCLIAYRPQGAPDVRLERARRSLLLPPARPVVLLHRDELVLGDLRFRLHVHGTTDRLHPPTPLRVGRAAAAAAVVALSASAVHCASQQPREPAPPAVETTVTVPAATTEPTEEPVDDEAVTELSGGPPGDSGVPPGGEGGAGPIEIREFPPDVEF